MTPKDFPNGLDLWREGKYFQTFDHEEAPWQAVPFYPPLTPDRNEYPSLSDEQKQLLLAPVL